MQCLYADRTRAPSLEAKPTSRRLTKPSPKQPSSLMGVVRRASMDMHVPMYSLPHRSSSTWLSLPGLPPAASEIRSALIATNKRRERRQARRYQHHDIEDYMNYVNGGEEAWAPSFHIEQPPRASDVARAVDALDMS